MRRAGGPARGTISAGRGPCCRTLQTCSLRATGATSSPAGFRSPRTGMRHPALRRQLYSAGAGRHPQAKQTVSAAGHSTRGDLSKEDKYLRDNCNKTRRWDSGPTVLIVSFPSCSPAFEFQGAPVCADPTLTCVSLEAWTLEFPFLGGTKIDFFLIARAGHEGEQTQFFMVTRMYGIF